MLTQMANQLITWQPGEEEQLRFKEGIITRKKTALLDVVDALVGGNLAGLCNSRLLEVHSMTRNPRG